MAHRAVVGAALVLATIAGAACSDDASVTPEPVVTTVGTSAPAPEPTTSGALVTFADGPDVTSTTGATPPSPATTSASTSVVSTVQSAGGWTLVVTAPSPGSAVGPAATVCYAVSGTAREPVVVLAWRMSEAGTPPSGEPVNTPIAVGAGDVELDLSGATPGRYDLEVGLVVDGAALDAEPIHLAGITLDLALPAAVCR